MVRCWEKIKAYLGITQSPGSAHILSELVAQSLRLQAVFFVTQLVGALILAFNFRHFTSGIVPGVWFLAVAASLIPWNRYRRCFFADAERQAHLRFWIRRWMWLTLMTGVLWGAGAIGLLLGRQAEIDQLILLTVVSAVVFISWPAFACWLPALTLFALTAIGPLVVVLAAFYGIGDATVSLILLGIVVYVLFCGRRFNAIVTNVVLKDSQNQRLVQRLRAEKTLAESERRATAAASERRARFFAGANHDLRQPLQAMGIYLQILQAKARPEDRETIEQLTKTARNISELVEQILEVSRIETGNVDMRIEKVSVPALFDGLAQEFAPVAAAKGFIFQVRPLDAFISTDEKLFSRILRNLISNAIRYSSKPASKIILAAKRRQGKLVIGVYDQGAGIKPEDRERIFDAFFRGGSSEGAEEGFGLGLSIVRALASRLSIPVDVKSRWGKGSIFLLSFEEIDTKEKTTGAALPLTTLLDIRGTVGFLEDNAIVRQAVTLMMKGWGGDIIDAGEATADFVTALVEKDAAGELTAFVSDYNLGLGKPTGLDVIFSLRKACARRVPCVLLTAVNEDDIRAHYRELCLNPDNTGQAMPVILQKPATPETLASALRQAIAEGQLR